MVRPGEIESKEMSGVINVETYVKGIPEALREIDAKSKAVLSLLLTDWPVMGATLQRLAAYLPDAVNEERPDALFNAVRAGLLNYRTAALPHDVVKNQDAKRIGAFVLGLLDGLLEELSSHWDVRPCLIPEVNDHGIWSWREVDVRPSGMTMVEVRKSLYDVLIDERVKKVLRREKYEASILSYGPHLLS